MMEIKKKYPFKDYIFKKMYFEKNNYLNYKKKAKLKNIIMCFVIKRFLILYLNFFECFKEKNIRTYYSLIK